MDSFILDESETARAIDYLKLDVSENSPLLTLKSDETLKHDLSGMVIPEHEKAFLNVLTNPRRRLLLSIKKLDQAVLLNYYERNLLLIQHHKLKEKNKEEHVISNPDDASSFLTSLIGFFKDVKGKGTSTTRLTYQEYLMLCSAFRIQEVSEIIGKDSERLDITHELLRIVLREILKEVFEKDSWSQKDEEAFRTTIETLSKKNIFDLKKDTITLNSYWKNLMKIMNAFNSSMLISINNYETKIDQTVKIFLENKGVVSLEIYSDGVILREIPSDRIRTYLSLLMFNEIIPLYDVLPEEIESSSTMPEEIK